MSKTLTAQELADHWGIEHQAIRMAAYRGTIPGCTQDETGHYIFDKEVTLTEWVPPSVALWYRKEKTPSLAGLKTMRELSEKYVRTLAEAVPAEEWVKVVRKALEQAKVGDHHARKWLSDYLMGTPIQRVVAEIDMTTHRDFAEADRAAAVTVLLQTIRERSENGAEAERIAENAGVGDDNAPATSEGDAVGTISS